MTCAAFASMDSSPAPPAPTPTSSHPKASVWHSSTPRSTTGCSRRYSPPTNHRLHFHSGAPSPSSIKRWTPTFITHSYAVLPKKTCHIVSGVGSRGALAVTEPRVGRALTPRSSQPDHLRQSKRALRLLRFYSC